MDMPPNADWLMVLGCMSPNYTANTLYTHIQNKRLANIHKIVCLCVDLNCQQCFTKITLPLMVSQVSAGLNLFCFISHLAGVSTDRDIKRQLSPRHHGRGLSEGGGESSPLQLS